ncbi:MAG: T9SS type A sorting domain-containing protein, partial [Bacteroidales bacterium]|nr:T9SS type A sorting domain-containing protein [Bacteroidales bacterium]
VENENDVVLSWDAVENEHLVYYSISRNGAEIATTTENTFTDAHLYPTAYEYQVRAFCGTDYGFSASSTASVTIEGGVERENVLVEVFSRVGCVYCPYTLRALDQMEATGNFNMIILDHQVGNDFEYAPSSNRMTYWSGMRDIFDELYDFDGTPSCVFDGYIGMGGAITDQTTATQYYTAYYEYVKAINSIYDFNIELLNDENNSRSFTLNVSAEKLSNYFGDDNITIVVALAEDLDYTWMGYNKLYNMVRGLYPDENGRTVTFDENNQYSTNFSIEVPQECNISRCKVVAWIENHTIGRVMQSKKIDLNTVVSSISEDSQSVSIYPNPSNGTFTIVGDFVSYEIFDITGKQIMHKEAVSNTETVDLSNYAKGIYTIRANDGNSVKVSKIVVE